MAHLDVSSVSFSLADGRQLLRDVSFRVGEGERVALIGANGAGKSTLLRIVTGELAPDSGGASTVGSLGVIRQFITDGTVHELLLSVAPPAIRHAASHLARAEAAMEDRGTVESQVAFASAVVAWGDVGGYDAEVLWDACTTAALGVAFERCRERPLSTLSGGEQKRLALESLLNGPDDLLLLDEPDNSLDVPGKHWLETQLRQTGKGVLYVSHDRELLARTATSIVPLELGAAGNTAWSHPGDFGSYHDARERRFERLDEMRRRWDEEREKLRSQMLMYKQKAAYNSDMTSRYRAAQTRLTRFEEAGPPEEQPREQQIDMRLRGGRTGKRVLTCESLELSGLMRPFDFEAWYGDRIAVLGSNGSGKSHFLRLLAAGGTDPTPDQEPVTDVVIDPAAHTGTTLLGARVRPGWFAQNRSRPDLTGRTLLEILHRGDEHRGGLPREDASRALARYELARSAEQRFESLSGGQQARFQVLLLELGGATMLLLDEPTDNLDLVSAEALQQALRGFDGTVLAVTHDRWFARDFERYLIFGADGSVRESDEPVWEEAGAAGRRS
ncbi:ATPase subunit of ABC transporter with duplicated ATPase domains [Brevibacterium sanguinis]|uniref:ATPase subunit of ABC transporter with duplicated ATPase domains n=2 Tax=Brevibacterium TaxID=1696 RepID=A0A366INC9_9MICO|nr:MULTISPECIES: ATP-binding cassette domain-containing protein [Brevibacterium]RBP67150.1 ATPase subunit of ABC transporter with duplicated ATPase domains [Brevibacterium sanguinis]RBP73675.1 ATPase subunit of ABC transporter with duplicated ATPase domains [Brevibacterium celere]